MDERAAQRGIYLIGFSGTGKSTAARAVAAQRGWPAFDLDEIIAERAGRAIPEIFQQEGEPGFRRREAEALREVSAGGRFVVATGGGAAVAPENRQFMAAHGWILCLEGRPETIHDRLQRQRAQDLPGAIRPLLDGADPLERIQALKQARQTAYSLADWTIHTDRLTPDQVVAEILRATGLLDAGASR
jgi:shikimate kinase